nr:MAG TPA: hypothetical protein [Caudoviricetes sp.]
MPCCFPPKTNDFIYSFCLYKHLNGLFTIYN